MQIPFTSGLEITISQDSLDNYIRLAHKYLDEYDATINVEEAGKDELGKTIFGICMRLEDGSEEEWYDPNEIGEDTIAGWADQDEAQNVLDTQILPNLGYAVYQKDLQLFHQNMIHE